MYMRIGIQGDDIYIFIYFNNDIILPRAEISSAHLRITPFVSEGVDVNPTRPIQTSKSQLAFYYYCI